jgi:hypothetical protein
LYPLPGRCARHPIILPQAFSVKPNKYEAMLPRLAQLAARHPRLYRARVLALGAFGYGLILGLLLFLVGALVLAVVGAISTGEFALLKLAVPLLVFIGVLVDALNIEIAPPKASCWAETRRRRCGPRSTACGGRCAPRLSTRCWSTAS